MKHLLIAATLASTLSSAHALVADYFVHFSASGRWSPVTTSVTRDAVNGDEMTRPAEACGMLFDGANDTDWLSPIPYNRDYSGTFKVWLPGPGCGAWEMVVVEGRSQRGQVSLLSGVAGQLRMESA